MPCTLAYSAATDEVRQLALAELLAATALAAVDQYSLTYNKVLKATKAFPIIKTATAITAVT